MTGMPPAPGIQSPVCFALQRGEVRLGAPGWVQALRDMDHSIREGERVALVGANGCGKSVGYRSGIRFWFENNFHIAFFIGSRQINRAAFRQFIWHRVRSGFANHCRPFFRIAIGQ